MSRVVSSGDARPGSAQQPAPGPGRPVVGRVDQLAVLVGLLDEVTRFGTRFVLVAGDAGVGKTTLVGAFTAALPRSLADRKATVIRGQCVPLGGDGLPYAPVVGALRALVGRYGAEQVLEWAGAGRSGLGVLLPDLIEPPTADDSLRLQLFEAVARLLEAASADGPLVVVMEDIHWADESTRHLLRFLVRALTDAPVLLLATYRSDELTRRHPLRPFLAEMGRIAGVVRLDVPRLERDEVAELLTGLLGHPPTRVVADLVHRRSEGIPYFVEELASSAAHGCIDMPDTLRDALNVRVQALSDAAQDTVRLAAVAGTRVDHELLAAVDERPPGQLDATLREAVDAAVLVADEAGYGFRHALIREVAHDDMLPGQHARLHARFAAALEARPDLAPQSAALEIAHHWAAAHDNTQAFRWSVAAAEAASPAHVETLTLYERALELWDRVADPESVAGPHVRVLDRAVRVAKDAGEIDRAFALNKAALAETTAEDVEGRVKRLIRDGGLRSALMKPGAVEALHEATRLLPADAAPALRARVADRLAMVSGLSGFDGTAYSRTAVAAAAQLDDPVLESNARNTFGAGLLFIGQEEEGLAELVRAGELAGADTRTWLRFVTNYSDALNHAGQFAAAAEEALAGIDVARDLGLERSVGAMLAGNAAEPLLAAGRWEQARTLIDRGLQLDPPAQHRLPCGCCRPGCSCGPGSLRPPTRC